MSELHEARRKEDEARAKHKKFIDSVYHLTEINAHTEARLLIAEYYKLDHYAQIFRAIKTIHGIKKYMPFPLLTYREQETEAMLGLLTEAKRAEVMECL